MRLPKEAQAEFRELAGLLLVDLKRIAPTVFEDFQ
jgi:thymidylate synthase ThyX